ncbi:MAG: FG-GAP repeat domain-containing protein [Planctomycetales bacterium]
MDYDGDGRLDLITGSDDCCNSGQFFLFRRCADGSFGARETFSARDSKTELLHLTSRTRVYLADWNLDNRLDLIVSFSEARGVFVSRGPLPDHGEFEMSDLIDDGEHTASVSSKPNVADWDDDGIPDLVVTLRMPENRKDLAYIFRGIRDTTGIRLSRNPILLVSPPEGARFSDVDVADWDGDGTLDLLAGVTWPDRAGAKSEHHSQVWVYRRIPSE